MIKPSNLNKGDRVALVSLSSGAFGEENYTERLQRTIHNLQSIFDVEVVMMPNALIGRKEVYDHPELRAKDLMDAFKDDSIKAIFTLTGGDDTIRILPYIDFEVIRNNPKIFMGYSDTTANHFMMYKAGITSYYGPAAGVEFSLVNVQEQNINTVINTLFHPIENLEWNHCPYYINDPKDWSGEWSSGMKIKEDDIGYDVIQGSGVVEGELLGGCIDVFPMINGTSIWPKKDEWKNKVLFVETSEDKPAPELIKYTFYNLGAQGILNQINAILIGRPKDGEYYQKYNDTIKEVTRLFGRSDLPIIANCHFGHAWLWNILPYGETVNIDCDQKTITLKESPTKYLDEPQKTLKN